MRDKLDTVWAFKKGLRRLTELKLSLAAIHDLEKAYLMAREREFTYRQNKHAGDMPKQQQPSKPAYQRDRGQKPRGDRQESGKHMNKWKRKFNKQGRREQEGGDARPYDRQRPHKPFHKGGNSGNGKKFNGKSSFQRPKGKDGGQPRYDGGAPASA